MSETPLLNQWNKAQAIPGGKQLFSKLFALKAPYFATVSPLIEELRPNYARVRIKKRRIVENHIRTVHVIAICNALEMAMGALAEVTIPAHLRWIPKGMSLDYTAKAGTDITAIAETSPEQWKPGDLDVRVKALDTSGTVVVQGTIKLWVSEKKKK
jgi:acyl-coenzyme A thioesterase PaaI-like protein